MAKRIDFNTLTESQKKALVSGRSVSELADSLQCSACTVRKLQKQAENWVISKHREGAGFDRCAFDAVESIHSASVTHDEKPIETKHECEFVEIHKPDLQFSERRKMIERQVFKEKDKQYVPNIAYLPNTWVGMLEDFDISVEYIITHTYLTRFAVQRIRRDLVRTNKVMHI